MQRVDSEAEQDFHGFGNNENLTCRHQNEQPGQTWDGGGLGQLKMTPANIKSGAKPPNQALLDLRHLGPCWTEEGSGVI